MLLTVENILESISIGGDTYDPLTPPNSPSAPRHSVIDEFQVSFRTSHTFHHWLEIDVDGKIKMPLLFLPEMLGGEGLALSAHIALSDGVDINRIIKEIIPKGSPLFHIVLPNGSFDKDVRKFPDLSPDVQVLLIQDLENVTTSAVATLLDFWMNQNLIASTSSSMKFKDSFLCRRRQALQSTKFGSPLSIEPMGVPRISEDVDITDASGQIQLNAPLSTSNDKRVLKLRVYLEECIRERHSPDKREVRKILVSKKATITGNALENGFRDLEITHFDGTPVYGDNRLKGIIWNEDGFPELQSLGKIVSECWKGADAPIFSMDWDRQEVRVETRGTRKNVIKLDSPPQGKIETEISWSYLPPSKVGSSTDSSPNGQVELYCILNHRQILSREIIRGDQRENDSFEATVKTEKIKFRCTPYDSGRVEYSVVYALYHPYGKHFTDSATVRFREDGAIEEINVTTSSELANPDLNDDESRRAFKKDRANMSRAPEEATYTPNSREGKHLLTKLFKIPEGIEPHHLLLMTRPSMNALIGGIDNGTLQNIGSALTLCPWWDLETPINISP